MKNIEAGDQAIDFDLPTNGNGRISLSDFKGRPVVLFFYPKDDTSGCTTEAIDFTKLAPDFEALGVKLVGLSPDSASCHDKFIQKHQLGVTLASDETKSTLEAYGVWQQKSMYGRSYMGVERSTFLIDVDGNISKIWRKVKVPGHAQEVLQAARQLP